MFIFKSEIHVAQTDQHTKHDHGTLKSLQRLKK